MKRCALVRRTPLRAKPPAWLPRERKPVLLVPIRQVAPAAPVFNPQPKTDYVRSEPYRRLVASLPCWRCGVVGYSQAAHADEGKGERIKACDLTCYPLCGPRMGVPGCHWLIGTSGEMPRELRREIEPMAQDETVGALRDVAVTNINVHRVLVAVGLL